MDGAKEETNNSETIDDSLSTPSMAPPDAILTRTQNMFPAGASVQRSVSAETDIPDMVPARMVNEFIFCPRLFYMEWVQGEWVDNAFTEDGRAAHQRADSRTGEVPPPDDEDKDFVARSVDINAPILGVTGKIDVIEGDGEEVYPIDYKRGSPPNTPEGAWDADRVQVAAYALALRENGYKCTKGIVFYKETHRRVDIPIDDELEKKTTQAICDLRKCAESHLLPQPLHLSPKCGGCSLNVICLPDEIGMIRGENTPEEMRLLYAPRDDSLPLYVHGQGTHVGISGGVLQIKPPFNQKSVSKPEEVRLNDISQVNLYGNVGMTSAAMRELCNADIPVGLFSQGGWFFGRLEGMPRKNIDLRRAQYRAAEDKDFSLRVARRIVSAKIINCRTMLRRNHVNPSKSVLTQLDICAQDATEADSIQSLLGVEGNAARIYFSEFSGMFKISEESDDETSEDQKGGTGFSFDFTCRNRRPPKDPVNAMLSYTYGMLSKDLTHAVMFAGMDPLLGFYHQPRYGRPGLALDLMEEFRPIIADSVVIQCINTGIIKATDFIRTSLGVGLTQNSRKKLIQAYERRMDQLVTHPVFGYRIGYRRVLAVQARLFGRFLMGEIENFPPFLTR